MSLEQSLTECDMNMSVAEVEAFCMGALTADDPMPLKKALKELFLDDTQNPVQFNAADSRGKIEKEIGTLWKSLEKSLDKKRAQLFNLELPDLKQEIEELGKRGDAFLMGLTLAGMSVEDQDDEVGDLLDEMEDHLLLMDEWIADGETRKDQDVWMEEGRKYRRELSELWAELQSALGAGD